LDYFFKQGGSGNYIKKNSEHEILTFKLISPRESQDKCLILAGQSVTAALWYNMISPLG